jgi:hypothetical protein
MLGRLSLTVQEAKEQYTRFGNGVFGQGRWFHMKSALWYPRPKYAATKVRQAILEVVRLGLRDPNVVDYEVQHETLAMEPRFEKACQWYESPALL